jgi:hypothetical protein
MRLVPRGGISYDLIRQTPFPERQSTVWTLTPPTLHADVRPALMLHRNR